MSEQKGTGFGLGALAAGILASVCCLGPAVLGALGLGTVALGSGLDKFRPLFAVATAGLLGAAFYFVYRKREVVCEDGSCRAESSPRATKIGLWIVAALAVGAFAFPYLRPQAKAAAALGPGEKEIRLVVGNMTCTGCAFNIQKTLSGVPGVKSAAVRFEAKEARVVAAETVAPGLLIAAVEKIGYTAVVK